MSDEPQTPSATPPTPAQGNDQAARTPDGTIKDQQATQPTTTPEPKQPEPAKPEPKADEGKKPDASAAPDKYEFKAPEGYEIDQKVLDKAVPIFKELGLTQDQASKLVDVYNEASVAAAQHNANLVEEMRQGWRNDVVKSDLGNGTDNLKPEVRANINNAINAIGDAKTVEAFKTAMDDTGVGDNPAFVRAMNAIGKALGEGTNVRGSGPSPAGQRNPASAPRSAAQALFPNLPSSAQS